MTTWWKFTNLNKNPNNNLLKDQLEIAQSLLDYCKLDTLAMVKIWQKFNDMI